MALNVADAVRQNEEITCCHLVGRMSLGFTAAVWELNNGVKVHLTRLIVVIGGRIWIIKNDDDNENKPSAPKLSISAFFSLEQHGIMKIMRDERLKFKPFLKSLKSNKHCGCTMSIASPLNFGKSSVKWPNRPRMKTIHLPRQNLLCHISIHEQTDKCQVCLTVLLLETLLI